MAGYDSKPEFSMKKKRLFYSNGHLDPVQVMLGFLTLLMLLFFSLVIYLMLFDGNPPAVINEIHYDVQEVRPGDSITYSLDWCKRTNAPVTVSRAWIGTFLEVQPPQDPSTGRRPVLGRGCYVTPVRIPIPALNPGEHKMRVSYIYEVNPLIVRTVTYEVGPIIIVDQ
jgi:hypothetical protein